MSTPPTHIRNFCIVAHIDHGKSTLADRMLELTGTVPKRELKEQTLDQMDIERERGITIKLAPVRMHWCMRTGDILSERSESKDPLHRAHGNDGGTLRRDEWDPSASPQDDTAEFTLHLIDTPGHVDFTYEVSRSLAAVEGTVLLVDASQGVQAQTIANLYLALEHNLTIIPAVNKIDLPNADVERTRAELVELLGCAPNEVLFVSGKTGEGVPELLDAIVERVPAPREHSNDPNPDSNASNNRRLFEAFGSHLKHSNVPLRALIFDSIYDDYRGVVAYVRIVDGSVTKGDRLKLMAGMKDIDALEVGTFTPKLVVLDTLGIGEIGYIVTGLKDIRAVRVGDTITDRAKPAAAPLPGYAEVKPMVYAGIFPKRADDTKELREGIERLRLNDASLVYEPEHSVALGFGFRCGFLGLLHLEVFQERLRREQNVEVVVTVPSVAYRATSRQLQVPTPSGWDPDRSVGTASRTTIVRSPQDLPDPSIIESIEEPWARMDIVTPERYVGSLMQLCQEKRGTYTTTEYLGSGAAGDRRTILKYELPLSVVLVDFYDRLKSASQGYASMNYELIGYRPAAVRRLDILVAGEIVEALSSIVYEDEAATIGRRIVERLKGVIPRQQFEVRLQAALSGKIVASERIPPLRKDVTAKLYGGDVTRKMKLLEKQKRGKKTLRAVGHVDLPPEAYLSVLKR